MNTTITEENIIAQLLSQEKLDPSLKDNIEKSSKFYKQWGDVSNLKFDEWWKTSKPLFGETRVKE